MDGIASSSCLQYCRSFSLDTSRRRRRKFGKVPVQSGAHVEGAGSETREDDALRHVLAKDRAHEVHVALGRRVRGRRAARTGGAAHGQDVTLRDSEGAVLANQKSIVRWIERCCPSVRGLLLLISLIEQQRYGTVVYADFFNERRHLGRTSRWGFFLPKVESDLRRFLVDPNGD